MSGKASRRRHDLPHLPAATQVTMLVCPHCGYDLERVENFLLGELEIVRGCEVRWKKRRVRLSVSQVLIVIALARADGATVNKNALCGAIGYDGEQPDGLIQVHICQIRKAFRAIDPGFDCIETQHGCHAGGGARWVA